MFENRELGQLVIQKLRDAGDDLVTLAHEVAAVASEEEKRVFLNEIAKIMGSMQDRIMTPIVDRHPDLLPPEWVSPPEEE